MSAEKSRFLPGVSLLLLASLSAQAQTETRYPVISKVRLVFSMVSHHNHIGDRVNFYNTSANPAGNTNYAVPHLVYEPVITLFNPYHDTLTLSSCRVRISDPPVGFAFRKNGEYIRTDFANGNYHGLTRFQAFTENSTTARKTFTLHLRGLHPAGGPGAAIVLRPGESKDFSPWVDNDWTWGLEAPLERSFFDWNAKKNRTNVDGRTRSAWGVETVPRSSPGQWDYRAGFQTDNLALDSPRPAATVYDFETGTLHASSYVVIKLTDTVTVEAKAMRTAPVQSDPDFRVEMLRGTNTTADLDIHRTYPMSLANLIQNETSPVISQTYQVGSILQKPNDVTRGGKTPFAMLSLVAKPAALAANTFYQTPDLPAEQLYDLRLDALGGYPSLGFPGVPGTEPALKIGSTVRSGNTLIVEFSGDPTFYSWRVMGTADLAAGFTEDLTSATQFMASPAGSGKHQAVIDVTGKGATYFVRIENAAD